MTRYYVKWEEKTTWHGYVEAEDNEQMHKIAEQFGEHYLNTEFVCVHEPVKPVMFAEDARKCEHDPENPHEYSLLETVTDSITGY